tara:strand:- start:1405 stop:1767 length:363 start_codon:yes stop_codon:yes gene_type:complete
MKNWTFNMIYKQPLPSVNWKVYFNQNENPRAKRFLESRGHNLFTQVGSNIVKAKKANKKEVVFLAHPNAFSIVSIPEKEYTQFLNFALEWFKKREQYETCSDIVRWKRKITELDKVRSLL